MQFHTSYFTLLLVLVVGLGTAVFFLPPLPLGSY